MWIPIRNLYNILYITWLMIPMCAQCVERVRISCNDNAREEIRCRVSVIVFYLFYSTFPFVPGVEIFFSDSSGSDVPAAVRLLLNARTILVRFFTHI